MSRIGDQWEIRSARTSGDGFIAATECRFTKVTKLTHKLCELLMICSSFASWEEFVFVCLVATHIAPVRNSRSIHHRPPPKRSPRRLNGKERNKREKLIKLRLRTGVGGIKLIGISHRRQRRASRVSQPGGCRYPWGSWLRPYGQRRCCLLALIRPISCNC